MLRDLMILWEEISLYVYTCIYTSDVFSHWLVIIQNLLEMEFIWVCATPEC